MPAICRAKPAIELIWRWVDSAAMKRLPASPLIARSLEIAEKHLGMRELAWRLHSAEDTIRAWREGHATMPQYKFLRLVDVLTELDPSWQDWDNKQG